MEFLTEDLLAAAEPAEDTLRAYLASHPERFTEDYRVTFSQIFLDPSARRGSLEQDASILLRRLNGPGAPDPASLGDSRMLEPRFENVPRRDVEAQFGAEFAAALEGVPEGRWQGPLPSGYGVHLVRVEARTPSSLPPFDVVREDVAREWSAAKRVELREGPVPGTLDEVSRDRRAARDEAGASRGGEPK